MSGVDTVLSCRRSHRPLSALTRALDEVCAPCLGCPTSVDFSLLKRGASGHLGVRVLSGFLFGFRQF